MDEARANILPRAGANAYDLGHAAIDALPQGTNAPLDKVFLQLPGVSQDSIASGSFHIRNEHENVQYRINGVFLPPGVAGFGQMIETSFVGNLALLDGALPAQYGLRTAGIIDITSRAGAFDNGGRVGISGGSQTTMTPTFEYGGSGSMNIPISPIITSIRITPRRSPARPVRHINGTGRASASI